MFGLSGRGGGLSCGEEAVTFGAALGLGQRGLVSLQPGRAGAGVWLALACTQKDKFSHIVENRAAAPHGTAHVVPCLPSPCLPSRPDIAAAMLSPKPTFLHLLPECHRCSVASVLGLCGVLFGFAVFL